MNPEQLSRKDQLLMKEYDTFNEQVKTRDSHGWTIASIFIPVSWLILTYTILNLKNLGLGEILLLAVASVSSCLILSVYFRHMHQMDGVSHAYLRKLEDELKICVHRIQYRYAFTTTRLLANNSVYLLIWLLVVMWIGLATYNIFFYPQFEQLAITFSQAYYINLGPDPKLLWALYYLWSKNLIDGGTQLFRYYFIFKNLASYSTYLTNDLINILCFVNSNCWFDYKFINWLVYLIIFAIGVILFLVNDYSSKNNENQMKQKMKNKCDECKDQANNQCKRHENYF